MTSSLFQLPVSPEVSPKHQQQHNSNLVKRSKLGGVRQVEPSFGDSLHKSMKLSPSHVGLDSGQLIDSFSTLLFYLLLSIVVYKVLQNFNVSFVLYIIIKLLYLKIKLFQSTTTCVDRHQQGQTSHSSNPYTPPGAAGHT